MNGTHKYKLVVIETGRPDDTVVTAEKIGHGRGRQVHLAEFPRTVTVDVNGDFPARVTFTYVESLQKLNAVETVLIRHEDSLARVVRALNFTEIATQVIQETGRRVRWATEAEMQDTDEIHVPTGGRVGREFAEEIARGRTKASRSVQRREAQALHLWHEIHRESTAYDDIYSEIAQRMKVGRTTVYRYLTKAGVVNQRDST